MLDELIFYTLPGIVVWFFTFCFMLALFRMKPMQFWRQHTATAITIELLIFIVEYSHAVTYLALFEMIWIVLALALWYRLSWIHACIVAITGAIPVFFVMMGTNYWTFRLSSHTDFYHFVFGGQDHDDLMFGTLLNIILFALLTWLCLRFRIGFAFVSANANTQRCNKKLPAQLILPLGLFVIAVLMFPFSLIKQNLAYLIVLLCVCLFVLVWIAFRQELDD